MGNDWSLEGFLASQEDYVSVRSFLLDSTGKKYHFSFHPDTKTKFMAYPEDGSSYSSSEFGEVRKELSSILGINVDERGEGAFERVLSKKEIAGFITAIRKSYNASTAVTVE